MTAIWSGSHKSLHGLLLWHSSLLRGLSILGTGGRSLSYIRCPLSGRIALLGPSAFLQPPYYGVVCRFSSRRLKVWSSCFQNLSPAHRWDLSMVKNWIKESTLSGMIMCSVDVALARWSIWSFSPLGIWTILACRSSTLFFTCFRYFFILSPLHS